MNNNKITPDGNQDGAADKKQRRSSLSNLITRLNMKRSMKRRPSHVKLELKELKAIATKDDGNKKILAKTLTSRIESLYDEIIAKQMFKDDFDRSTNNSKFQKMVKTYGYKLPILNLLYDAFLDEVPSHEEVKDSLETLGILSALTMTCAFSIPLSFSFEEFKDLQDRNFSVIGLQTLGGNSVYEVSDLLSDLSKYTAASVQLLSFSVFIIVLLLAFSTAGIETNFEKVMMEKAELIEKGDELKIMTDVSSKIKFYTKREASKKRTLRDMSEKFIKREARELRRIWWGYAKYIISFATISTVAGTICLCIAFNRACYVKFLDKNVDAEGKVKIFDFSGISPYSTFRSFAYVTVFVTVSLILVLSCAKRSMGYHLADTLSVESNEKDFIELQNLHTQLLEEINQDKQ